VKLFLICAGLGVTTLSGGCVTTMASGDAGCVAYGEARTGMPDASDLPDEWLKWVAEMDTRLTAVCR